MKSCHFLTLLALLIGSFSINAQSIDFETLQKLQQLSHPDKIDLLVQLGFNYKDSYKDDRTTLTNYTKGEVVAGNGGTYYQETISWIDGESNTLSYLISNKDYYLKMRKAIKSQCGFIKKHESGREQYLTGSKKEDIYLSPVKSEVVKLWLIGISTH